MKSMIIVLDNVRSALNVGSILRTADGAGAKKVVMAGITPYPPHPKVVKTALGAEAYVESEHITDLKCYLDSIKSEGYVIVSIEQTEDAKNIFRYDFPEKVAFIFGNEITGVSMDALSKSDTVLELPMLGKKKSLNISNTCAIVSYMWRSKNL